MEIAEGAAPPSARAALQRATQGQLANLKSLIFFASVFVAVVPPSASPALLGLILVNVLIVETAWYGVVATAFSVRLIRDRYVRAKAWADRVRGGALELVGLRLALG